jgi:hypothetical protein
MPPHCGFAVFAERRVRRVRRTSSFAHGTCSSYDAQSERAAWERFDCVVRSGSGHAGSRRFAEADRASELKRWAILADVPDSAGPGDDCPACLREYDPEPSHDVKSPSHSESKLLSSNNNQLSLCRFGRCAGVTQEL